MTTSKPIPAVSFQTARTGASAKSNALGMRPMQERAYNKRGEQYLLIKSPPASGKSRALMTDVAKKVDLQSYDARTLPFVVAADLERGSLETLPGYIAKHQGIPDSDIAMNLLKLIIGSAEETPFRLVAIRHPDLKPNTKGSGPRGAVPSPRQKDHAIVAWYGELVADFGKGEAVITHMLTVTLGQCPRKKAIGKLSRSVIREALRRVRHEEATVRELQQRVKSTLARREASLAQIKDAEVVAHMAPAAAFARESYMTPQKLATNPTSLVREHTPREPRDKTGSSLMAASRGAPKVHRTLNLSKPRRKASAAIELNNARDVYAAIVHACHLDLAPNRHLTINWEETGVDDPVAATGQLMKLMRDGARRHGAAFTYIWVREKGSVVGEHVHILFHLPTSLEHWFRRNKARWLKRCGAQRVAKGSKTTRIHGYSSNLARHDVTSRELYLMNLQAVVDYVLKHCSLDVQHTLGIVSKGPCHIVGKRVSISQNLGRTARNTCPTCVNE